MSDNQNLDVLEPSTQPAKKAGIAHRLYTGEISYDFVGKRNRWYLISGIVILISIAALGFRGINWGIEFTGGAEFHAPVAVTATTVEDVRSAVAALNIAGDDLTVTTIGNNTVRVQTAKITSDTQVTQVKTAIATGRTSGTSR